MNLPAIDWNEAWMRAKKATSRPDDNDKRKAWDKRAPLFAGHVKGSGDYIHQFLRLLSINPAWSVLDVGCATGTLAVPLAKAVKSVTALDISPVMIDLLRKNCEESGVSNVTPIIGRWEDDWEQLGIGTHDVAIASRSFAVDNLADGIAKLNRAARHMVSITAMAGDGPSDQRIDDALGRPQRKGPDYIYVYNYLHQLGIYADVHIIKNTEWKAYESQADALEKLLWSLGEISVDEERKLKQYLASELVPHEGKWRFSKPRVVRWAYISWKKTSDMTNNGGLK